MLSTLAKSLGTLTTIEQQLQRRARYARPACLPGAELTWVTAWGDCLPAVIDARYLLVRIDRSKSTLRHRSAELPVRSGMAAATAPYVPAIPVRRDSPFTSARTLLLEPAVMRRVVGSRRESRIRARSECVVGELHELRTALDALFDAVADQAPTLVQESALLSCACAAATALGEAPREEPRHRLPQRIRSAVAYLHDRFCHDITIDELNQAVGGDLHPRYLLSLFKQEVGIAPHQYMLRLRVRKARELLAKGLPAAQVATTVGFCDAPQLHGHFVRIVGMTPGAYAAAVRT